MLQRDVEVLASTVKLGIESLTSRVLDERTQRAPFTLFCEPKPTTGPTAHLDRLVPAARQFGKEHRETFIRAGDTPSTVGRWVDGVLQPRPASARRCCGGLDHQLGPHQLGEVLADSVVVQAEVIGQLRDADRHICVDQVLKDGMAGGVAERACLHL